MKVIRSQKAPIIERVDSHFVDCFISYLFSSSVRLFAICWERVISQKEEKMLGSNLYVRSERERKTGFCAVSFGCRKHSWVLVLLFSFSLLVAKLNLRYLLVGISLANTYEVGNLLLLLLLPFPFAIPKVFFFCLLPELILKTKPHPDNNFFFAFSPRVSKLTELTTQD